MRYLVVVSDHRDSLESMDESSSGLVVFARGTSCNAEVISSAYACRAHIVYSAFAASVLSNNHNCISPIFLKNSSRNGSYFSLIQW